VPGMQFCRTSLLRCLGVVAGGMAAPLTPAFAQSTTAPEPANVPPPSAADIRVVAPQAAPAPATGTTAVAVPPSVAKPAEPAQPDRAAIQHLTGKDLVQAPLATNLATADVQVGERLRGDVGTAVAAMTVPSVTPAMTVP
jgi:hypothetical protein